MSLINTPDTSTAGKQARAAAAAKQIVTGAFAGLQQTCQQLVRLVWQNPDGLTPAQVSAALGTDAAALFALGTIAGTALTAAAAALGVATPTLPAVPTGYSATSNQDGTVTIGLTS